VIQFFSTGVRKFRVPGCPGNRIRPKSFDIVCPQYIAFIYAYFGSKIDLISRCFGVNKTILKTKECGHTNFPKNVGAV
jgi:hypothetical protein